jgi:glycosyltransferase involved in cell wall biosynthesis
MLKGALNEIEPEVIISVGFTLNFYATLVSKKVIIRVDNALTQNGSINLLQKFIYWISFNRAWRVVTCSSGIKHDIEKNVTRRVAIDVIQNAVDCSSLHKKANKHNDLDETFRAWQQAGKPVIVTAGRFTQQKGHWHLIRALSHIRQKEDAKLLMLGEGEYHSYYEQLINELDLEQHVRITGFVSNPYPYIAHCTVFAFPSLWEGFGLVLIEAMALGRPVVSTDCLSGPREILAPDCDPTKDIRKSYKAPYGILAPVPDGNHYSGTTPLTEEEYELSSGITMVLESENLAAAYRQAASERAEAFDIPQWKTKWNEYVRDLLREEDLYGNNA